MEAWSKFLHNLETELGSETIAKWITPLKVVHFDACNLYLEANDSFQILWFEEHIRPKLGPGFVNNNNHRIKVHLTLAGGNSDKKEDKSPSKEEKPPVEIAQDLLDPWATFENFIQLKENVVPFKLFCEMAGYNSADKGYSTPTLPLGSFNPIYLHGNSGSGKTHLLMALAKAVKEQGQEVFYVKAETFTGHVISAIRGGNMQEFRKAYRHVDLLIVDDIHVLARRGATQEELFHTFNTLHTSGKQVILGANCAPQLLSSIEERLVSRFEWGIVLSLEKLGQKEEAEMVKLHSEALDFPLDEKATEFICNEFSTNPHSLHQAIEALILRTHLNASEKRVQGKVTLTSETLQKTLGDLINKEKEKKITPNRIIEQVAEYYGIQPTDILGKGQAQEFSIPRQVAMHICRYRLNLPFIKIGTVFGRDHSTVMSSVKQIQKKIDQKDKEICTTLSSLQIEPQA